MGAKKTLCVALLLTAVMLLAGCSAKTEAPANNNDASTNDAKQAEVATSQSDSVAASPSAACPSVNGRLSVQGTYLVDESGNPVQLRGASTHGIAWFPEYVSKDTFSQLAQWGANVVRLAMYTSESGGYCTGGDQEELLRLLDQGVQYAKDADMYVIIDWHILSDGDPTLYQAQAEEFFAKVCARYADCNHVLYEICNEPNGGTSWATVKAYAQDILPIIRANDSKAVVLVGTPNWCQYLGEAAADPLTGYENVMYALHFYAATHKQDLRDVYSAAIASGLPVFVSEYGLCEASGAGTVDTDQADAWVSLLNENNTSYVLWSLCNKDESASILRADCTKVSGFTQDDLSPVGQWLVEMLSGQATQAPESADSKQEVPAGTLSVSASCVNQWEEDGTPVRQYTLTLQNATGESISGWSVSADLSDVGELKDSWNGSYTLSGTKIDIAPAEYNAEIAAGASLADVGFIVKGAQVEGVEVTR